MGVGAALFGLGIPTAFNLETLELYDELTAELLLPFTMLLLVIFVGWRYTDARIEVAKGMLWAWVLRAWLWHLRTVLLVTIALTLGVSLYGLLTDPPELLTAVFGFV